MTRADVPLLRLTLLAPLLGLALSPVPAGCRRNAGALHTVVFQEGRVKGAGP